MDTIKRKTKRATPRSKKTIRKMTPLALQLALQLAHLTRTMQSSLKRLAYLTEALYELERSERAAQAQIVGHALVCPLVTMPTEKPAAELWPDLPNGEGVAPSEEAQAIGPDSYRTASEIEQGQDHGL
jgi:hypothetical protein